jgi:multidrug resistance efflux pump
MEIRSGIHLGKVALSLALLLNLSWLTACTSIAQLSRPTPTPTSSSSGMTLLQEVSADAQVVPARWVQLGFPIGGLVQQVTVNPGDLVQAGQVLASLQDTSLRSAIAQAQAALLSYQNALSDLKSQPSAEALAAAQANLASAQANLDRLDQSGADQTQKDAAQAAIDSAQMNLDQLKAGASDAQLRLAQAQVDSAQAALDQAQAALNSTQLLAPFAGQVIEVDIHTAEIAPAGQPVITLADPNSYQIETTDLSELDLHKIAVSDPATITLDALPGLTLQGKVSQIALKATPGIEVTYQVVISLDDMPLELRWGMSAFVKISPK